MRQWFRTTDMVRGSQTQAAPERWSLVEDGKEIAAHDLLVRKHKPIDLQKLKRESLSELRAYASGLKHSAQRLYSQTSSCAELKRCPCCAAPTAEADTSLAIFGVVYLRCPQCGHAFVHRQPSKDALTEEFRESESLSATYIDRESCEERLRQVVTPKLKWLREVFYDCHELQAASVVDVGAGGGHFVEMARRGGMDATGFELSEASRRFARAAFGLELLPGDFLQAEAPPNGVDCLTFWGVLEYVPDPGVFLKAARRWLHPRQGLVVLEVPRFDCLGTTILRQFPDTVYRHMEPTSHVHCFSDASVANLLHDAGLAPVAAWYFGMDVHELLTQQALALDDPDFVGRFSHLVGPLQATLDANCCCDDVIIAARPI